MDVPFIRRNAYIPYFFSVVKLPWELARNIIVAPCFQRSSTRLIRGGTCWDAVRGGRERSNTPIADIRIFALSTPALLSSSCPTAQTDRQA
ncbi:hypothetical protein A0H81_12294 [Grifola frondosa]|uniref:Uncharacterized protein n=1 Tax=Grifola frondosa TaxID=5627 RepID=A0A1C7LSW9_GRIFR|nr:hypothetical protein A0H81_12294 [Grifola frondosa]